MAHLQAQAVKQSIVNSLTVRMIGQPVLIINNTAANTAYGLTDLIGIDTHRGAKSVVRHNCRQGQTQQQPISQYVSKTVHVAQILVLLDNQQTYPQKH